MWSAGNPAHLHSVKSAKQKNIFFLFLDQNNETVLLNAQNICYTDGARLEKNTILRSKILFIEPSLLKKTPETQRSMNQTRP